MYLNLRLVVSAPRVIGEARPYVGYEGSDRDLGVSSIRYPVGAVIDLNAGAPPSSQA